ncbi:hypothetical protein V8E36_001728 [Tilletia maclaganii]
MEEDSRILRALLQELTIPVALRPGFDAVEDDEGAEGIADSWVRSRVPSALDSLLDSLDGHTGTGISIEGQSRVAAAAARFWSPVLRIPAHSVLRIDEDDEARRGGVETWTTADNIVKAEAVLDRLSQAGEGLEIALHLLQHYIRPLFSHATATSSSLDPDTGRARHANPLLTSLVSSHQPGDDASLWKGAATQLDDIELLGQTLTFDVVVGPSRLATRNAALGCWNVFAWCLAKIARTKLAEKSSVTAWEQHWALVLPPLLTLLEDADPHFRLIGTRILLTVILNPSGTDQTGVPASLLIRTNVVPLLMNALETSYTFITSGRGHVLLDAALAAARQLVILTTAPIVVSTSLDASETATPQHSAWLVQDQGLARLNGLTRIMTEGIFKVWSFPVKAGTGKKASQRHELVRTSFRWMQTLVLESSMQSSAGDAGSTASLGIASARFIGIVCEFVGSWVEREWASTWVLQAPSPRMYPDPATIPADLDLSPTRQRVAASLLASAAAVFAGTAALVQACAGAQSSTAEISKGGVTHASLDLPPGVETWAGRVLLATSRLWTLLYDAGLLRVGQDGGNGRAPSPGGGPIAREAASAREACRQIWRTYKEIDPAIIHQYRAHLLKLDPVVFTDLCQ